MLLGLSGLLTRALGERTIAAIAWGRDLSLARHYGEPMIGGWDPAGIVASLALAFGGLLIGVWGCSAGGLCRASGSASVRHPRARHLSSRLMKPLHRGSPCTLVRTLKPIGTQRS